MIGDTAYLNIPGCLGTDERVTAYAEHCQELIKSLDSQKPKGWVVDLRDNDGGNCWAMLTGLGPLFENGAENDDGLLGRFVMRQGKESFGYRNGQTWS